MKYLILIISSMIFSACIYAADVPMNFDNPEEEQRFNDLIKELRCLVCQNQNLADSHADLAQDLREEIYKEMQDGKNNEQIIEYLVARYGDFVLYRPPLNAVTLLLWIGPAIFLFIGIFVARKFLGKSKDIELTSKQQQYASQLLGAEPEEGKKS